MEALFGFAAVFLLVFANGFFVAAEFSLVSARRTRIEQLAQEGNRAAIATRKAISHLDSYIAATQLGITLASLGLGFIGEPTIGHFLSNTFCEMSTTPLEICHTSENPFSGVGIGIAFAFVTLLHIVLGELVPKSIALQRPESTALIVARPTGLFHLVFNPVIVLMNGIGNGIIKMLGFEPAGSHASVHSPEELEMLVASSREAGLLQESEEVMLRRVFDFSDLQVREVMRPRTEVDAIPVDMPIPEILRMISSLHYSRYPVYQGSVDTIVGLLNTKDLLDALIKQPQVMANADGHFSLQSILRTPIFVPQTTSIDRVLDMMQKQKQQMAIVIDEYGGMAGIATMEDILEEIIGEVQDEFDVETNPIETQGDVTLVDGLTTLSDIAERFGNVEGKTISTTIGGYVAERLDRIPVVGDTVSYGEYDLRVEEMDGLRASKLRFIRRTREQDQDNQKSQDNQQGQPAATAST